MPTYNSKVPSSSAEHPLRSRGPGFLPLHSAHTPLHSTINNSNSVTRRLLNATERVYLQAAIQPSGRPVAPWFTEDFCSECAT